MSQKIIRIDLGGVNCYLGRADDNFILFDTGGHLFMDKQFTNRREALEKELEKAGCKPGNLKLVVLTHGDLDHTANAAFIRDSFNTRIAMHQGDLGSVSEPGVDKILQNCRYRSLINSIVMLLMKKQIKKLSLKIAKDFEGFKPDFFIDEGFDLQEYGFEAKVMHIPGHTSGSIGILTTDGDLISGDTFINAEKPDIAPNAYDFKKMKASANRLKALGLRTVYPGHGEPFDAKLLK
jgi:glyoxylase-like metal-dependent hydrolase (beta-lactamase superfamily II)